MSTGAAHLLPAKLAREAQALLLRVRTPALATLLAACIASAMWSAWSLIQIGRANSVIRALQANKNVAVDPAKAKGDVLLARLAFLLRDERVVEAQALVDASRVVDAAARAKLVYMLAGARVRGAIALIDKGRLDRAIPEVNLAKEGYREVLHLDPQNWDARNNLDVASRLVRDLPGLGREDGDTLPDAGSKLWIELPGAPKGLP